MNMHSIYSMAHTNICACYQKRAHVGFSDIYGYFAHGFYRLLCKFMQHGLLISPVIVDGVGSLSGDVIWCEMD